ncbi:MOSC domain-containing protein [Bordetella genomosp. 1]|uniref:MOSC domain-containing protein n=1 Tax=Bordetella genomosp. 1 TaxID=1395607 RepID=A0ABX4F0T1_9BORD|nr:MOSC domain-containing protein [Bordetella genomosp. 1]OZI65595.1 MOSC domain-containing protein [Bordetella genomosp. 1]
MSGHTIRTVLAGPVAPLGDSGKTSAIAKHALAAPVAVGPLGLAGDEQADPRFHGGPEKAVHHYAYEHYPFWQQALGAREVLTRPGAFGENISTVGLTEREVCIGDIYRCGTLVLQVSQARQPCWKLDVRFAHKGMAAEVQRSGLTGWYYRVLEPGTLHAGAQLERIARPRPGWTLARIQDLLNRRVVDGAALAELADMPELSPNWRALFAKRREAGVAEDWNRRLRGDGL